MLLRVNIGTTHLTTTRVSIKAFKEKVGHLYLDIYLYIFCVIYTIIQLHINYTCLTPQKIDISEKVKNLKFSQLAFIMFIYHFAQTYVFPEVVL